jgi:thioredoxin reductase (NADPH)
MAEPGQENGTTAQETRKVEQELKEVFGRLEEPIPVYLFAGDDKEDVFAEAARRFINYFNDITGGSIAFEERGTTGFLAEKYHVTASPTILIDPEHYSIRWLGAPLGEEGRMFVEALLMVGFSQSGVSSQSVKVLDQIDAPRQIKLFVSHSCPYCPQQAQNALKAAVYQPEHISLEIIDIQANPELARSYDAESVPQTYANDLLIAMGAQQEELFMLSLQKMEQQSLFIPDDDAEEIDCDLVIIGGGPAGLSAGIYASRSGMNAVIVERSMLGGQVATTPIVENYPGLTQIGGKNLVDIMASHALQYVKQIYLGEDVVDVTTGDAIQVVTTRRRFNTKALLLATGASHKRLGVPGEERLSGRGVSYCSTCDGPMFKGRSIIMVGGGDSAATDTLHLHNLGVGVTLVHRGEKLDAQDFLARQLVDLGIPIFYQTEVREILGDRKVEGVLVEHTVTGEKQTLKSDGVFIAIGYIPSTDLAEKIGVSLTPQGYIHQKDYRTNIPGVYAAGDVTGGYNQIVAASGHGAEAALRIFEDSIKPYWKKGEEEEKANEKA